MLTVEELGALVELVGRAPMSKAERLWVAALMERLRDWVLSADSGNGLNGSGAREGGNMEDAEGDGWDTEGWKSDE